MSDQFQFKIEHFETTLKEIFKSLIPSMKEGFRKVQLIEEVKTFFEEKPDTEVTPECCLCALYAKAIKVVPINKINEAKLASILQIIKIVDPKDFDKQILKFSNKDYSKLINRTGEGAKIDEINTKNEEEEKEEKEEEKESAFKSEILDFVKHTKNTQILDIQREIKKSQIKIADLAKETKFMVNHINNKLAKISRDLDEFITTSLNLNDPVELDKTDKKMIRSVIDAIHITNTLNVEMKKKKS